VYYTIIMNSYVCILKQVNRFIKIPGMKSIPIFKFKAIFE